MVGVEDGVHGALLESDISVHDLSLGAHDEVVGEDGGVFFVVVEDFGEEGVAGGGADVLVDEFVVVVGDEVVFEERDYSGRFVVDDIINDFYP